MARGWSSIATSQESEHHTSELMWGAQAGEAHINDNDLCRDVFVGGGVAGELETEISEARDVLDSASITMDDRRGYGIKMEAASVGQVAAGWQKEPSKSDFKELVKLYKQQAASGESQEQQSVF